MKYVAAQLISVHNVGTAEEMVLGMSAGLDAHRIYDVVVDGPGNSSLFELRGRMMVTDAYDEVTMKISVWQIDIGITGALATALGERTPAASAHRRCLQRWSCAG
jgi:putative dehydrogenase